MFGCIQVVIKPPVDKDGKITEGGWFDVNRVEIVNDERVMPVPAFDTKAPKFGKTPASHTHGPAEKPARPSR